MEFTGERYVPSLRGQIYYEHLHRYAIAARFCAGKRVLDIASGEGYGSALLARTALEVIGVDVDQRAVDHARRTYYAANLRFIRGSTSEIPIADGAVDVVASFETIEHVGEHERMLDELRRVLAPGGILVISSPNKLVYSDVPGFENPFHEKELYFSELRDLLVRRYRHVAFYGQRLTASSVVHPLAGAVSEAAGWFNGTVDGVSSGLPTLRDPVYFVAICSDAPLTIDASSSYLDAGDDLLTDIWDELNTLRSRNELAGSRPVALADGADAITGGARHALPQAHRHEALEAAPGMDEEERARLVAECDRLSGELSASSLERAKLEGELLTAVEMRGRLEAEVVLLHEESQQLLERARDEVRRDFEYERSRLEQEISRLRSAFDHERVTLERRLALEAERASAFGATVEDLTIELERERDRAVVATADIYEERARNAALLQQLADQRAARSTRDAEHAALLDLARAEVEAAEHRLGAQRDELEGLQAALERAQADGAELQAHVAAVAEAAQRDSVALREVLSSRSWKMTSPLRRAFGTMRR